MGVGTAVPKDEDARRVVAELDAVMAELREVVASLNARLLPPEANPDLEQVIIP